MKKYVITIEETVSKDFEVYAEDIAEALGKAEDNYRAGIFVLDPGELIFKQIAVTQPNDECTEWHQF